MPRIGSKLAVAAIAALSLVGGPPEARAQQSVTPTMRQIFESMAYLLPRTIDDDRFSSPEEREEIEKRLAALTSAAGRLEAHGRDSGQAVRFLSLSLAEDVEEARMRYAAGQYDEARYYLIGSIQNCVACHSRKQSDTRFDMAEELTERVELAALSAHEKAQLYVVTRRFDEALSSWEALFRDPTLSPTVLDFSGAFLEYLAISIRGMGQYERPLKTLGELAKRPDLPTYLRALVARWSESLRTLIREKEAPRDLARARDLIERARAQTEWPNDRGGLVYDLAASAILNEKVDVEGTALAHGEPHSLTDAELSEAFYMLGVVDSRSMTGYWIDQSPSHLEASIRLDPGGESAARAYRLLEEDVLMGYGGAAPEKLPTDVGAKLEELRGLMEAARSAGG